MSILDNQYDLIIIGAGISGLVAAHTILEKEPSLDVIILEAKDRTGGRTLSMPVRVKNNSTCLFDFGAQWVSSSQIHLQKFLTLLDLHLVPQQRGFAIGVSKKDSFQTYEDHPIIGNIFSSYEIKWFFAWFEQHSESVQIDALQNSFITGFYDSITMEGYINSKMYTTAAKNVVKNIIKTTTGVHASQISVMFYLLLCHSTLGFTNQYMNKDGGGREFWIEEGAQEICNRLEGIIGDDCVKLKHPVIEINHSKPYQMQVKTDSGKIYNSTHIICAIPPDQILQINFVPPLSRQRKLVLEETQVGHLTKFVISYKTPFWRYQGYSGEIFASKDGPISICYDVTKNDNPALVGYITEPINLPKGPDGTYRDSVIQQLKKYYGKAATIYIDYKEISWGDELYVGGCPMTCTGIGTLKYHHTLTQPLEKIYWAGAETATEWKGYMDGAIQSGYRAALNVLFDMRPQSISYSDLTYVGDRRGSHVVRLKNYQTYNSYTILVSLLAGYVFYKVVIKRFLSK